MDHPIHRCLLVILAVTASGLGQRDDRYGRLIGRLNNFAHGIAGTVYAVSDEVLFIKEFEYDGTAPDAYFWVGNGSRPSPSGTIVPYPTDYVGREPPVLGRIDREDVLLKLPRGIKVKDLRWLSVWCRRFTVDFGSLVFPANVDPPKPKQLGELKRLGHGVRSGPIVLLDTKTFYIPNLHYDGAGPDAFFWVGKGPEPNSAGTRVPNELGNLNVLRGYQGEDIEIQLPDNLTVHDIDWLSIWCIAFRENFGHIVIPKDELDDVPPALGQNKLTTTSTAPTVPERPSLSQIEFGSCIELLGGKLQVQWAAIVSGVIIRLSGRIEENEYMAFGVSGAEGRTQMLGGDVTVAYFNSADGSFHVDDYILSAKSQCDGTRGVCPDQRLGGVNDVTLLGGHRRDGITTVVYQRSLTANEFERDKEIPAVGRVNVIAAVGPLNGRNEANYHFSRTGPNEDHRIDFTSHGVNQCPTLLAPIEASSQPDEQPPAPPAPATTENPFKPWKPSIIQGESVFTARIGPTGGKKGYTAITGQPSWGIAWYINDLLIPEIYVEEGKTYTFIVEGGNDPTNAARYHPLYITDSPEGGFGQKTEEEQQLQKVYAGVSFDDNQFPIPTAAGPLCEWTIKTVDKWAEAETFEDYKRTLVLDCPENRPTINLTWTVPKMSGQTVYYQCYTHNNLGWKIHVVSPGFKAGSSSSRLSPVSLLVVCLSAIIFSSAWTWWS